MNSLRLRCCNYALVIDVSVLHFSPNGKACAWLHLVAIKVGGFETALGCKPSEPRTTLGSCTGRA